jgi:hypothetical protein
VSVLIALVDAGHAHYHDVHRSGIFLTLLCLYEM